jgi:hypothetical protein
MRNIVLPSLLSYFSAYPTARQYRYRYAFWYAVSKGGGSSKEKFKKLFPSAFFENTCGFFFISCGVFRGRNGK